MADALFIFTTRNQKIKNSEASAYEPLEAKICPADWISLAISNWISLAYNKPWKKCLLIK